LKNEKSLKYLLIQPLHLLKGVVVIYRSREELLLTILVHSNGWDGNHRWRGGKNSSWT